MRALIEDLRSRQVALSLDGEELIAKAPPGVVTREIQTTLRERKQEIVDELKRDRVENAPLEALTTRSGSFPLSSSQERLWYLEQIDASTGANHVPFALRLTGTLDLTALRDAVNETVRRHAILRTTYAIENDVVVQVIGPHREIEIPVRVLPDQYDGVQTSVNDVLRRESARAFNLEEGPLIRVSILQVAPDDNVLHVVAHHSIIDGWSIKIFIDEVASVYTARVTGTPPNLPERSLEYVDYAVWQKRRQSDGFFDNAIAFWKRYLTGAPPAFSFPTDQPRPANRTGHGQTLVAHVPADLTAKLGELGRANSVTPFMTLLAVFNVLLYRYSKQTDIVIGSPVANRTDPRLESLVGLFANTIVVRSRITPDLPFRSLLTHVKESCLDVLEHQHAPFEAVVDAVNPVRDLSRTPIFQVFFAFLDQPDEPPELPGIATERVMIASEASQTDLSLWVERLGDGLQLQLEFDSDLLLPAAMQRVLQHYIALLQAVVDAPETSVDRLRFMSPSEEHRLVEEWNRTDMPPGSAHSVQEMVRRQTTATPDRTALQDAQGATTYRDLDARSDALADRLVAVGLDEGGVVGVCLHRTPQIVVSLLAVFKAGGTYVPLDPEFPAERLAFMVGDANVSILLTDGSHPEVLTANVRSVIDVSGPDGVPERADPSVGPRRVADHAYIIYTSGSTGQPKGVCVPHRCVVNFLLSMQRQPGITADDVLLSVTTPSFDISVLELFLPLTVGAKIHFADAQTVKDGRLLADTIDQSAATIMQATPTTWRLLIEAGWSGKQDLRVLSGGEQLARNLARELVPRVQSVWNMYGPTETTIWSTCGQVGADDQVINVGRPIANTQIYILESTGCPAPMGVVGDVYIGGAGVTDGYLGRPDLTAEAFVQDTVSTRQKGRMYRTGDLGRWRENGVLEIVGRADRQVKVRGYRIEPAEIEAALSSHPAVRECVVEPREVMDDDVRLVAYVVHEPHEEITVTDARRFLRAKLPSYMVPGLIVAMSELPLTPNGKVDRDALPDPLRSVGVPQTFEAPESSVEKMLASIWTEVLGVTQVGRRDNFFELGGHSLLSMRVVHAVRRTSGHRIDPQVMYFQNLEQIARLIPNGRAFGT